MDFLRQRVHGDRNRCRVVDGYFQNQQRCTVPTKKTTLQYEYPCDFRRCYRVFGGMGPTEYRGQRHYKCWKYDRTGLHALHRYDDRLDEELSALAVVEGADAVRLATADLPVCLHDFIFQRLGAGTASDTAKIF